MCLMKMNPVVHFEMPAEDRTRTAQFYSKAFGWQTKMLGPERGDYVVVTTTESDDGGPKTPGAINGGFFLKGEGKPSPAPSCVNARGDISQSMTTAKQTGPPHPSQP